METIASLVVLVACGYAPDTDLDNVRIRVVGILLGLLVTAFVNYIWPERVRIESVSSRPQRRH